MTFYYKTRIAFLIAWALLGSFQSHDASVPYYNCLYTKGTTMNWWLALSKKKTYFQAPFLVLQLVTYKGLVPVPGRTNQYMEKL